MGQSFGLYILKLWPRVLKQELTEQSLLNSLQFCFFSTAASAQNLEPCFHRIKLTNLIFLTQRQEGLTKTFSIVMSSGRKTGTISTSVKRNFEAGLRLEPAAPPFLVMWLSPRIQISLCGHVNQPDRFFWCISTVALVWLWYSLQFLRRHSG